jgi:uncharacterized membrane protein (UPF0182 family)
VLIAVLVIVGAQYTNLLWFRSVGFSKVFSTQLTAKIELFFVFGLVMALVVGLNIYFAYRLRPAYRPPSLEQQSLERYRVIIEPYQRLLLIVVLVLVGFSSGLSAAGRWQTWLTWRNGQSFGIKDAQFHKDISYFAFTYPFQRWILGFAFTAVVLSIIAVAATNYLYGGLRVQTPGEKVTEAARAHLSFLLGLFVLLKAVAYFLDRYGLAFSLRGVVQGPSYTDVHAVLPAKTILVIIAVVCSGLFFANIAYRRWTLPIVGFGVMVISAIVVGGVYPAIVQQFQVRPNEADKEAPYIARNIAATRTAYGLPDLDTPDQKVKQNYPAKTTATPAAVQKDAANLSGIRLIDPNVVAATYNQLQQIRGFYSFPDVLDIDRYAVRGKKSDSVVAVRDIALSGLGADQSNWINRHLVYTHGFGFVGAPTNSVDADGKPVFFERNIPPIGALPTFEPRVYFGENSPDYSIVGGEPGKKNELDRPTDNASEGVNGQVNTTYAGKGGVPMGSFVRRALYAVKFKEKNILLSGRIGSSSRILYTRDPRDRVRKVAPYLRLDGDPYPVVEDGRIKWIVDGYTTTNSFPYSQRTSLGVATEDALTETKSSVKKQEAKKVNYIRNSVKATVDAYDGTVTLYEWDETDPILKTWEKVFPNTVRPKSEIPSSLAEHFRYPEDFFKVQRTLLTKYHVGDAGAFYTGQDFWTVPNDPTVTTKNVPQPPYYYTLQVPGASKPAFSLTTTLNPRKRSNMAAFVSVNSDPGPDYGKFTILQLPRDTQINGVEQVGNNFETFPAAASELSLLRRGGSQVTLGNLQAVPVAEGFLFVEPVYVKASGGTSYPLLKRVFASFGDSIAYAPTLQQALDTVFEGSTGVAGPTGPTEPSGSTAGQPTAAVLKALADVNAALAARDKALKSGDLVAYAQADKRLTAAINRLNAAVSASSTTTPSGQPSASASPTQGPSP